VWRVSGRDETAESLGGGPPTLFSSSVAVLCILCTFAFFGCARFPFLPRLVFTERGARSDYPVSGLPRPPSPQAASSRPPPTIVCLSPRDGPIKQQRELTRARQHYSLQLDRLVLLRQAIKVHSESTATCTQPGQEREGRRQAHRSLVPARYSA
jgi:hypothetical protein